MSDNWGHFFTMIGDHQASILFDDGFASEMNQRPDTLSITITVELKETNAEGLTTDEEFKRLSAFKPKLLELIESIGGIEVGQITFNGRRILFSYGTTFDDTHRQAVQKIADEHDYEIGVEVRDDPERKTYWDNLYPSPEERQIVSDIKVLNALAQHGNIDELERPIEHMSIFSDKASSAEFVAWAEGEGYEVVRQYRDGPMFKKRYFVETHHVGPTLIGPISQHSLAHFRKANELGGSYDGWGCEVRKAER